MERVRQPRTSRLVGYIGGGPERTTPRRRREKVPRVVGCPAAPAPQAHSKCHQEEPEREASAYPSNGSLAERWRKTSEVGSQNAEQLVLGHRFTLAEVYTV